MIGQTIGPYRIESKLGEGGMGEVWKARDARLNRLVAIKTSKTGFADRFASEARAVAALNHPSIGQLYDVGTLPDGEGYLVMEFIDGEPIAPVDSMRKLLDLAVQIADGLAAAHAAGFTHRDLKPSNVLVTGAQSSTPGRVKILDFGLVKQAPAAAAAGVTQTAHALTSPGTVLGTASYMSPEQARGEEVDARSDQFSFGLIVYELATGKRPFARSTVVETMTAIIREDAEPLPPSVPAPLRWVVERCLAKDPAERYDSTRDLFRELKHLRDRWSEASAPHAAAHVAGRSRARAWGLVTLVVLAAAALTLAAARFLPGRQAPPAWSGVMLGGSEMALYPRLSPDGHLLAFQAMVDGLSQIAVMKPESGNWSVLTRDREHGPTFNHGWSPDGTLIYYDRLADVPQGVFSVPVLGGDERLVLENAFAPEPLPDGSLLVVKRNAERHYQVHRFWPETGRLEALPLLTTQTFVWVRLRAFRNRVAAVTWGEPLGQTATSPGFHLIDLAAGNITRLSLSAGVDVDTNWNFSISPDGASIIASDHAGALTRLMSIPLSGAGRPTPLLTTTATVWSVEPGPGQSVYANVIDRPVDVVRFAPDGTGVERLASFAQVPDQATMAVLPDGRGVIPVRASSRVRLMVVQPGKDPAPLLNTTEETASPVAACGPREVAFLIGPEPHETIALADPASGRLLRTIAPGLGQVDSMSCSPDGTAIYVSARGVVWSVPAIGLSAGGAARKIRMGDSVVADPSGRRLILQLREGSQLKAISVPLDGGREQEVPTLTSFSMAPVAYGPQALHADGRLLTALIPRDSWFNPPAVLDTRTGRVTRIPSDMLNDYQSMGWTADGRVMAMRFGLRATLWKFQPESR